MRTYEAIIRNQSTGKWVGDVPLICSPYDMVIYNFAPFPAQASFIRVVSASAFNILQQQRHCLYLLTIRPRGNFLLHRLPRVHDRRVEIPSADGVHVGSYPTSTFRVPNLCKSDGIDIDSKVIKLWISSAARGLAQLKYP